MKRQYRLESGSRIDILTRKKNGTPVIIEIKKGSADDGTLTQLISYLFEYKRQFPKENPQGMIVCGDASSRLRNACEHLSIDIRCYGDVHIRENDFE